MFAGELRDFLGERADMGIRNGVRIPEMAALKCFDLLVLGFDDRERFAIISPEDVIDETPLAFGIRFT